MYTPLVSLQAPELNQAKDFIGIKILFETVCVGDVVFQEAIQ